MSLRPFLLHLLALLALGCDEPSAGPVKPREKGAKKAATTKTSTQEGASAKANPPVKEDPTSAASEPASKDSLKLKVDAEPPKRESEPVKPQKSDPECEAEDAPGKAALTTAEQETLLKTYLDIQKSYLGGEKGAKDFKLIADPASSLSYRLSFKDIFGAPAEMVYKFGKAIVGSDDRVTLCLDQGKKLLWAGTYRRDKTQGFVPDI